MTDTLSSAGPQVSDAGDVTPTQTSIQPLIVDHFAGGGGASVGIELALGRGPDIAINHDADAIATHEANHPQARHYRDDIWNVDPHEAVAGRPVSLLWTSPSCTHHSRANPSGALSDQLRALPWTAVRWAEVTRPAVIITENVAEMTSWGPLALSGRADPARSGETYREWLQALGDLGYVTEQRVLDAADYGAPQHRQRLFVVARRDGAPVTWPEPTHGPGRAQPWVTALSVLDLSVPGETLTQRRRSMSSAAQTRVVEVLDEYGIPLPGGGTGALYVYQFGGQGRRLDRPAPTLTAGDRLALATRGAGGEVRFRTLLLGELAALMGFPSGYTLPGRRKQAVSAIGNAVCPPVAAAVVRAVMATPVQQAA